jgi:hypothetical protein
MNSEARFTPGRESLPRIRYRAQPYMLMDRSGFFDRLGRENICAHIEAALIRAREILGLPPASAGDSQKSAEHVDGHSRTADASGG